MKNKHSVLIIPDLHIPFEDDDALGFCKDIYKKYNCSEVIQIGDLFDQYCFSSYIKNPEASLTEEMVIAREKIKKWYSTFPRITITLGNHCIRIYKRAKEIGIPCSMLKSLNEIFNLPKTWVFKNETNVNDIKIFHGFRAGDNAALLIAKNLRKSVIVGHNHSALSIQYLSGDNYIFGVCCGALINIKSYAFEYAKDLLKPPMSGCCVLIDKRFPVIIPK